MADKDGDAELPRRMPGAARTGPPSPAGPVLSEELRRRMRDAVKAERAEVPRPESAAREEPGPAAGSPVTARSPVNGSDGKRNGAVVELAARTGSVPGDDI
ncbi:MAG: hypothetical protein JO037_20000, partial [Actinobacteria bacterium]|nr:hypothetical protein [Actinomycetota bacterium]